MGMAGMERLLRSSINCDVLRGDVGVIMLEDRTKLVLKASATTRRSKDTSSVLVTHLVSCFGLSADSIASLQAFVTQSQQPASQLLSKEFPYSVDASFAPIGGIGTTRVAAILRF